MEKIGILGGGVWGCALHFQARKSHLIIIRGEPSGYTVVHLWKEVCEKNKVKIKSANKIELRQMDNN